MTNLPSYVGSDFKKRCPESSAKKIKIPTYFKTTSKARSNEKQVAFLKNAWKITNGKFLIFSFILFRNRTVSKIL